MPTETVYGLAANARDGRAIAKIYEAKGRPSFNPLIIHCASLEQAQDLVEFDAASLTLARRFWPGPLTLVLPRKKDCGISELASAGLETLAVRVPSHPIARKLIDASGFPLAAPSANRSGYLSPTTPVHVQESLGAAVDLILADGACAIGLESSVVMMQGAQPVILRPGAVTAEDISQALGRGAMYETVSEHAPLSPGQLLKHYAPDCRLRMNAIDLNPGEALLAFGSTRFMGIKGGGAAANLPDSMKRNLSIEGDLHEAAAHLFAMLKDLDKTDHVGIAAMAVPETGLGVAINDRLRRAAAI